MELFIVSARFYNFFKANSGKDDEMKQTSLSYEYLKSKTRMKSNY